MNKIMFYHYQNNDQRAQNAVIMRQHDAITSDLHKLRRELGEVCRQAAGTDNALCSRIAHNGGGANESPLVDTVAVITASNEIYNPRHSTIVDTANYRTGVVANNNIFSGQDLLGTGRHLRNKHNVIGGLGTTTKTAAITTE